MPSRAVIASVVAALAVAVGGCESAKTRFLGTGPGMAAPLRPLGGSAATGSVAFAQFQNGVSLDLSIYGLRIGRYRVVIHTTGNCSSPNGFSAGPPYSPPGVEPPLDKQIRPFYTSNDNSTEVSVRLVGVTLEGPNSILGRSVVVHEGAEGSLEAVPDVRNGRVACGIIGPVQALF